MEVTTVFFRLLMLEFIPLVIQVRDIHTQESDAVVLHITPNQLQHFQYQPVSFRCESTNGFAELRGVTSTKEFNPECVIKRAPTGSLCTIDRVYSEDGGEYWCETEGGERSNSVNITITENNVILESPVLPVLEGGTVTLRCRSQTAVSNLTAEFYKDDVLVVSSPAEEMIIKNVLRTDEGVYRCSIPDVGASPGSLLVVRAGSVILESPVLPEQKGDNVTLRCKKATSSNHTADFHEDVLLIRTSSTGEVTIQIVSKSDDGLYNCNISDIKEPLRSWLEVRAPHQETCPSMDLFTYVLLLVRTGFTILMVLLLLLLVGLLHCGKLRVQHK